MLPGCNCCDDVVDKVGADDDCERTKNFIINEFDLSKSNRNGTVIRSTENITVHGKNGE